MHEIERKLEEVTRHYGFKSTLKDIEGLLSEDPAQIGRRLLYLSKWELLELFSHYERVVPIFPKLPPHARISIDVFGINTKPNKVEIFQLEANLFEDLAAL